MAAAGVAYYFAKYPGPQPLDEGQKPTQKLLMRGGLDEDFEPKLFSKYPMPNPEVAETLEGPERVAAQLKLRASHIYGMLSAGELKATCTPDVQEDLQALLRDANGYENLWIWTFERNIACHRSRSEDRAIAELFKSALRDHGQNPRVLELLALQNLLTGNPFEAIKPATDALRIRESYEAWNILATATLAQADDIVQRDRGAAQPLYKKAFDAASHAETLASAAMRPFQLVKMAQAEIGLGRPLEALELAVRAEEALRSANSGSQAKLQPDFYMQLGSVYYRAGHRDVGIAFMDQAIAMTRGNARFIELKDQILASAI